MRVILLVLPVAHMLVNSPAGTLQAGHAGYLRMPTVAGKVAWRTKSIAG